MSRSSRSHTKSKSNADNRFFKPAKRQPLDSVPFEIEITSLSHDGRGLAHQNGKTLFVDGALPGERVRARYTTQKSSYSEAQTLEVLSASTQRVPPACPHFSQCGGCQLQHLSGDAQIASKQQQALEQLQRIGGVQPAEILTPLDSDHWLYRRRARLGLVTDNRSGQVSLGFRRKQSNKLVAIEQCPVLDPRGSQLLGRIKPLLNQLQQPQAISHIEICLGDTQAALVVRHPKPLPEADQRALQALLSELGFDLFLQPGTADTLHALPEHSDRPLSAQPLTGQPLTYQLPEQQLTLQFQPKDFTQVNAAINRQLVNLALELLTPGPDDRILDLFCGLGNFTLPLARYAQAVVGVEAIDAMVQRGRDNAVRNRLDNVTFIAADLSQPINDQPRFKQLLKSGFNKVLLDPPRAGAFAVLAPVAKLAPAQILYISCDPATLARDAAELNRLGYRLQRWTVVNMFPQTSHVESIALFNKNKVKQESITRQKR